MRSSGVQGRTSGVRGLLVYCSNYKCAHLVAISADQWPDDVRLSDLEPHFVCKVCGHRGADVKAGLQLRAGITPKGLLQRG